MGCGLNGCPPGRLRAHSPFCRAPPTQLAIHAYGELGRAAKSQCAIGAAEWRWERPASSATAAAVEFAPGTVALDTSCARRGAWLQLVQSAMRRTLATAPSSVCPHTLFSAIAAPTTYRRRKQRGEEGAESSRRGLRGRPRRGQRLLGCEWSYEPTSHAVRGHHLLGKLPTEGLSSLYLICSHTLAHQAFARVWGAGHDEHYKGRACGCGQRVQVPHTHRRCTHAFTHAAPGLLLLLLLLLIAAAQGDASAAALLYVSCLDMCPGYHLHILPLLCAGAASPAQSIRRAA